jgi:tripartite-type tricarboxylate transporter receptor subunit TctC
MRLFSLIVAALLCLEQQSRAEAQAFPTQPIKLVVPFAAGGNTDIVARLMAEKMSDLLGQPVVVENRVGAGGITGSVSVARAEPDGYTILMGTVSTHAIAPSLTRSPLYNPINDFAPISLVANVPNVVVVHPSVPAKTLKELADLIRAEPDKYNFGSPGVGTVGHLAGAWFNTLASAKSQHVPYRGSGPAMNDLVGGKIQFMFDNVPPVIPQVQSGNLRALAIPGPSRVSALPSVETSGEAGFPQFLAYSWNMLLAPAKTPEPILERLSKAAIAAANDPAVRARLIELSTDVVATDRDAARIHLATELAKWKPIIEASGIVQN